MTPAAHPYQATCVEIDGRGLLILGPSGSGKSSLALSLIDRGARLVGDDSLLVEERDGRLLAGPHPNTRGLLEIRNLGLLAFPCAQVVAVALAVVLDPAAPRYIEEASSLDLCGAAIPSLALCPHDSVLPLKAELALRRFGLGAGLYQ